MISGVGKTYLMSWRPTQETVSLFLIFVLFYRVVPLFPRRK
jgi:hypothetical protein